MYVWMNVCMYLLIYNLPFFLCVCAASSPQYTVIAFFVALNVTYIVVTFKLGIMTLVTCDLPSV